MHELMHELRVSKIEMEMQNDALRQSQIEIERSRDRYVDLYDFALTGYLTLNNKAMIEDINLPAAQLLGVMRQKLLHRRLTTFISPPDQDCWNRMFIAGLDNDQKCYCELKLQKADGTLSNVMLICQRLQKTAEEMVVRIVLVDLENAMLCKNTQAEYPI